MRTRLGCLAAFALASLTCATPPAQEPHPERFACPRESGQPVHQFFPPTAPYQRVQIETGEHGTFLVQYRDGGPVSWQRLVPSEDGSRPLPLHDPSPAPLELAPPELTSLIPDLQPLVDNPCLATPQVSYYLGEIRDRVYSRWWPPALPKDADRNVLLVFSLSESGEVTGACFKSAANDFVGASAVRALYKGSPYVLDPEQDPAPVKCLAGKRVSGSFTVP